MVPGTEGASSSPTPPLLPRLKAPKVPGHPGQLQRAHERGGLHFVCWKRKHRAEES